MNRSTRSALAVIGTLAASASTLTLTPAQAVDVAPSNITVHSTDYNVASGEQFRLFGRMTSQGDPVPDATVRVKTFRHGEWVQLKGAVVTTNDEGKYRVRIVLQMKGKRLLRVIGNPPGDDIATARRNITIIVHLGSGRRPQPARPAPREGGGASLGAGDVQRWAWRSVEQVPVPSGFRRGPAARGSPASG